MMQNPIAIIGAMQAEIDEILKYLENKKKTKWKEFVFYEGKLFDKEVVLVKSGVGKVFAALATQKLIDTHSPSVIIFTGVAGAINPKYEIGDIVVAEDCVQHDMDASEFGYKRGEIPYSNYRFFRTEEKLKKVALNAKIFHTVHQGRILTGDQFLSQKDLIKFEYLRKELEGDAVEMEGAAVAQVATVNEIPFLIIRTISDKADQEASLDYTKFFKEVGRNSLGMIEHILKNA